MTLLRPISNPSRKKHMHSYVFFMWFLLESQNRLFAGYNLQQLLLFWVLVTLCLVWFYWFKTCSKFFVAVVKTTVLLADINDFAKVNDVYKTCECIKFFYDPFSLFCLCYNHVVKWFDKIANFLNPFCTIKGKTQGIILLLKGFLSLFLIVFTSHQPARAAYQVANLPKVCQSFKWNYYLFHQC